MKKSLKTRAAILITPLLRPVLYALVYVLGFFFVIIPEKIKPREINYTRNTNHPDYRDDENEKPEPHRADLIPEPQT